MIHKELILPAIHDTINQYDKTFHTLSGEYKEILLQKGIKKDLLNDFLESIHGYSANPLGAALTTSNAKAYSDYIKNLEAVLGTIRKMNEEQFISFCSVLKNWLDKITFYREDDLHRDKYEPTREKFLNQLFFQLGDAASKRRVATSVVKRSLMENFNNV